MLHPSESRVVQINMYITPAQTVTYNACYAAHSTAQHSTARHISFMVGDSLRVFAEIAAATRYMQQPQTGSDVHSAINLAVLEPSKGSVYS